MKWFPRNADSASVSLLTINHKLRLFLVCLLFAGLVAASCEQTFAANGTVTNCSFGPGAGTFSTVLAAVQGTGGGTINFTCSGTLTVPGVSVINSNVTISGASQNIVFDGGNSTQIFNVSTGASLTLQSLTLTKGSSIDFGGAIASDGNLTLDNTTVSANYAPYFGGGIYTTNGTLKIINNSKIINNIVRTTDPTAGGGINSGFTAVTISDSMISGNLAEVTKPSEYSTGGGIRIFSGSLTVNNSVISNNSLKGTSPTTVSGGGIYSSGTTIVINNSTISGNQTQVTFGSDVGDGGGIYSTGGGSVSLNNSTLSGNSATNRGGGVYLTLSTVNLNASTISGNSAIGGSGVRVDPNGILNVTNNSTFTSNSSPSAGYVIDNSAGNLSITDSTILNNGANSSAAISNTGTSTLTRSTLNSTGSGSGLNVSSGTVTSINSTITGFNTGINNSGGTASLTNSTIAANGTGIAATYFSIVQLANSIVTNGCTNAPTDLGNNIQFPGSSCGASILSADPKLGPLANNGGLTQTMALQSGSPALDAGNNGTCSANDQRGFPRPQGPSCDIGAYEAVNPPKITKAFGTASLGLNASTSLAFTITNPSLSQSLSQVAFTDALPAGLIVATPNGLVNGCGGTITATSGSNSVSLSNGTLANSANCTIKVNVTGVATGLQTNQTGPVTAFEAAFPGQPSNTASLTVFASGLTLTNVFSPASISVGAKSNLTFTITNPDTVNYTGLSFSNSLPAGLVVSNPSTVVGNCNGGTVVAVAGSSTISLTGGSLAPNTNCVISVSVTGTTAGSFNNQTGPISSNEAGSASPSNLTTLTVTTPAPVASPPVSARIARPDITMLLRFNAQPKTEDGQPDTQAVVILYLTVKNEGDGDATRFLANLPLDPNLQILSASFNSKQSWVKSIGNNSVEMDFGRLEGRSPAIMATIRLGLRSNNAGQSTPPGSNPQAVLKNNQADSPLSFGVKVKGTAQWEGGEDLEFTSNSVNFIVGGSGDGSVQYLPAAKPSAVDCSVTVKAAIFIPDEGIAIWLNQPDGKTQALDQGYSKADGKGQVSYTYSPASPDPGVYSLVLYGKRSQVQAVVPLRCQLYTFENILKTTPAFFNTPVGTTQPGLSFSPNWRYWDSNLPSTKPLFFPSAKARYRTNGKISIALVGTSLPLKGVVDLNQAVFQPLAKRGSLLDPKVNPLAAFGDYVTGLSVGVSMPDKQITLDIFDPDNYTLDSQSRATVAGEITRVTARGNNVVRALVSANDAEPCDIEGYYAYCAIIDDLQVITDPLP